MPESEVLEMKDSSRVMIEAKGLSKYFGPFVAIEDISFSIPAGQIVAFLGPNGAGKSTTMRILTGYMAPSEGSAHIAGLNIHTERIPASRKLGYLPENGPLYLDMTPKDFLQFFGEARGLEEVGSEPPHRLGQRTVFFARCHGEANWKALQRISSASGGGSGSDA